MFTHPNHYILFYLSKILNLNVKQTFNCLSKSHRIDHTMVYKYHINCLYCWVCDKYYDLEDICTLEEIERIKEAYLCNKPKHITEDNIESILPYLDNIDKCYLLNQRKISKQTSLNNLVGYDVLNNQLVYVSHYPYIKLIYLPLDKLNLYYNESHCITYNILNNDHDYVFVVDTIFDGLILSELGYNYLSLNGCINFNVACEYFLKNKEMTYILGFVDYDCLNATIKFCLKHHISYRLLYLDNRFIRDLYLNNIDWLICELETITNEKHTID